MVGGEGERYLLKVAKHVERYNLFFGSPELMKRKISILRVYCNTIGRDTNELQFSVVLPCIIGESEDEVYQSLVRHKRNDKTLEEYLQYLVGGITIGIPEKIIKGWQKHFYYAFYRVEYANSKIV